MYKIVAVNGNKLLSLAYWLLPDSYVVEYKVGEFVSSRYGKLFVFKELADAFEYIGDNKHLRAYECEVTEPEVCEKIILKPNYLEDSLTYHYNYAYQETPKGTYLCSSVKLLREV